MMNYFTFSAFPYESDFSKPAMLDLDGFDSLTVITTGNQHVVVDNQEHRMYDVKAETPIDAIRKYIDWVYGECHLYEWDGVEGGWNWTNKTDWASNYYEIEQEKYVDWEIIMEC